MNIRNPIYYEKSKKQFVKQNRINEIYGKRKKELQRKSSIRAKRDLTRIIYCNVEEGSKFLTLTYKDNIIDLGIANNGFIKINEIQNTSNDIEKVKNYMLKDIMKNDIRLIRRKRDFNSRGIKRPEEIKDSEEVEDLLNELSMDYFKGGRITENNYNKVDIKKYVVPIK